MLIILIDLISFQTGFKSKRGLNKLLVWPFISYKWYLIAVPTLSYQRVVFFSVPELVPRSPKRILQYRRDSKFEFFIWFPVPKHDIPVHWLSTLQYKYWKKILELKSLKWRVKFCTALWYFMIEKVAWFLGSWGFSLCRAFTSMMRWSRFEN